MADLSITVASVVGAKTDPVLNAGATITAGESVYLDTTTNTWKLASAAGAALLSGVGTRFGISLHAALSGQPLCVQETGQITPGATLTLGIVYVVSGAAPGGIAPLADISTTAYYWTFLGFAISTTVLDMSCKRAWGVQHG